MSTLLRVERLALLLGTTFRVPDFGRFFSASWLFKSTAKSIKDGTMNEEKVFFRFLSVVLVVILVVAIGHSIHEEYGLPAQLLLWLCFWFSVDLYSWTRRE